MMESLREYILSVAAASILCSLTISLAGRKNSAGPILKMLGGLFLALTVVRPLAEAKVEDFLIFTEDLHLEAEAAAAMGQAHYEDSMAAVITEQTRTYILDKAQTLDTSIAVEVTLDAQNIPWEVTIGGQVSPKNKAKLEAFLASELGIPKERQIWIESPIS